MKFPICRWGGEETDGRRPCASSKLIAPNGVTPEICERCPYRDHEPVADEPKKVLRLGDAVESALSAVGITKSRWASWFGNCNCKDRQERLNKLSALAEEGAKKGFSSVKAAILTLLGEENKP